VTPFTFTFATPEGVVPPVSVTVPLTVIVSAWVVELLAGEVTIKVGGVVSGIASRVTVTAEVEMFPAVSVAITVIVFEPIVNATSAKLQFPPVSKVFTPFTLTFATPEGVVPPVSKTVPLTVVVSAWVVELFSGAVTVIVAVLYLEYLLVDELL
jgi:hypothetical protein